MNSSSAPSQPPFASDGNRPGRIGRLALKELRETLRDRRTIVTLVLMPLIVYPMLSLAFQKFLLTGAAGMSRQVSFRVGVESEEDAKLLNSTLKRGLIAEDLRSRRAQRRRNEKQPGDDNAGEVAQENERNPPKSTQPIEYFVSDNFEHDVSTNSIDVGVRLTNREKFKISDADELGLDCELVYYEPSLRSRDAAAFIERVLGTLNADAYRQQLRGLGVAGRITVVRTDRVAVAATGTGAAPTSTLATLVPLILILMTITGAVYPAIDLTAGERERGTLEMLIAAPVPRLQLLLAKYVAVVTVALLTATVNLTSMMITVSSMGLTRLLFGEQGLSVLLTSQIFALLVLFAAFFAAVLLAVTSFARSFKEAQAYLIPLMLVSIAPGLLSMIPGLSLHGPLAVTPLINIVLLARDLFAGEASPIITLVVVATTALFALAAIGIAARVFGTDAILYGSEGAWGDLFRRPRRPASEASFTSALLCLALMFPGNFLAANLVARSTDMPMAVQVALTAVLSVLLFAGIPALVAVWNRVRIIDGFRIKPAPALTFVAAAILGVSLWAFAHEVVALQQDWGIVSFSEEQLKLTKRLLDQVQQLPLALLIFRFGIIPAVCEEFFFRGYLLGALSTRIKARDAIIASALLFGLFHVLTDQLAVERFLSTATMGLFIGWVRVRTGSILPGMLLHAVHNSLIVLVFRFQDQLEKLGLGLEQTADMENAHLPATWIAGAAIVAAAGLALMIAATPKRGTPAKDLEPAQAVQ
ncbi:MAG: ABC transporter permease subunit/CPBP intramembrane protease [Planctomycetaceae bacterium]